MIVDKDDKILVIVKDQSRKGFIRFIKECCDLAAEGHQLISDNLREAPKPHFKTALFIKSHEGTASADVSLKRDSSGEISTENTEKEELTPLEVLEMLVTKKDMLAFAEKHNVVVPETAKAPKAIQKAIRVIMTADTSADTKDS